VRILGVDPGSRRIGLALSDEEGRIALPLDTLVRSGEDAAGAVAERARHEGAREIVIGLPLEMDGTDGPAAKRARRFAAAVERASGVHVVLWDERLTTVVAERALREAGVKGADRKRVVDQAAATVLLQGYLDARGEGRKWREDDDDAGGDPESHAR
jgi:putative Holliday junction resolvase